MTFTLEMIYLLFQLLQWVVSLQTLIYLFCNCNLKDCLCQHYKIIAEIYHFCFRPTGHYTLVDILVCTPGRLVDHLKLTAGFTLRNIKYLVIDEADRLLSDSYADWLALSMKSVHTKYISLYFLYSRKAFCVTMDS